MDLPIITIAVLAVLAIVFLVAMVKSMASNHWLHVALVLLTFVSAVAGAIVLSRSYKTRAAWQRVYQQNLAAYNQVKKDLATRRDGSQTATTADIKSVRGASSALERETFGKGRVWVNGTPVKNDAGEIVVTLPTITAADNQGIVNEQPATQLQPRMLVYVFQDTPIPNSAYNDPDATGVDPVQPPDPPLNGPSIFLGVMQVTNVSSSQVTLKGTNTLDIHERQLKRDAQGQVMFEEGKPIVESVAVFPEVARQFDAPSGTWTLFEKAPADARDAFKRLRSRVLAVDPLADTTDIDAYQQAYRADLNQYLPAELFGLDLSIPEQAARYEAIIDRYAFDQMRLTDVNNWITAHPDGRTATSFDPPSDERFVMLKFNATSEEYEVDTNTGSVRDSGAFDPQGRAVLNILWATKDGSGKIRIEEGTIVVVDPDSAQKLRAAENVEVLGEVYVRRLDDFASLISNQNLERERLFDGLLRLIDEIEKLKVTDTDLQAQERQRAQLNDELTQDQSHLDTDAQAIDGLRQKRIDEIVALKDSINQTHQLIGLRYDEIKRRSIEMLNASR